MNIIQSYKHWPYISKEIKKAGGLSRITKKYTVKKNSIMILISLVDITINDEVKYLNQNMCFTKTLHSIVLRNVS